MLDAIDFSQAKQEEEDVPKALSVWYQGPRK